MGTLAFLVSLSILVAVLFEPIVAANPFLNSNDLFWAADAYMNDDAEAYAQVVSQYGVIENWDVSKITDFGNLFSTLRNANAATFQADLSLWNVENAEHLHDMFHGAALFDTDMSGWGPKVGNVVRFNGMFEQAASFRGRGMETWNVTRGAKFMVMFAETPNLESPNLDVWDVRSAQRMVAMFRRSNFNGNLCSWRSKLQPSTDMRSMFFHSNCDIDSVPNLNDATENFFCVDCGQMVPSTMPTLAPHVEAPIYSPSNWPSQFAETVFPSDQPSSEVPIDGVDKETTSPSAFPSGEPSADPTFIDTPAPSTTPSVQPSESKQPSKNPSGAPSLTPSMSLIPSESPGTYFCFHSRDELIDAVDAFLLGRSSVEYQQIASKYGPIEKWDVSRVSHFDSIFDARRNPRVVDFQADLSMWSTDSAIYMRRMFFGAEMFDSDLSRFRTGNVLRFNEMFGNAKTFRGRGLQNWDVSRAEYFNAMFAETDWLDSLNVQAWDVSNGKEFTAMFRNANFRGNPPDLCAWLLCIKVDAIVRSMFFQSSCPISNDPELNPNNGTSMCIECIGEPEKPPSPTLPPTSLPEREVFDGPNILLIMTDQQRFDALRRVQDELEWYDDKVKVRTPNLDKLSREGAFFRNAYCQCSVCGPSRTSIRTGCTVERTGVQTNELVYEYEDSEFFSNRVQNLVSIDQILVEEYGYESQYFGKWHIPRSLYHSRNGCDRVISTNDFDYEHEAFEFSYDSNSRRTKRFLQYFESVGNISRAPANGQQLDSWGESPYQPIKLDSRYGYPTNTPLQGNSEFDGWEQSQPSQCGLYGLSENYTSTYFTTDLSIRAIERLKQGQYPWFVTVSYHSPHAPMIASEKYLEYYWEHRDELFIPPSLNDDLANSPYGNSRERMEGYTDEEKVREWTAVYLALVEEIDAQVGRLIEALGDARNHTLIVFTSDHGEMLGAHGKREKNNFYDESARVPLLISFPGTIAMNRVIDRPVSHLDLFSTVLDYVGVDKRHDASDGTSLKSLIEEKTFNDAYDESAIVAEWDFRHPRENDSSLERRIDSRPALMVRHRTFKLMFQKLAESTRLDCLFDLESDPFEQHNLIGKKANDASIETLSKAEHLRCLLLDWMHRMDGSEGYYSHPRNNFGETRGDITEVEQRQSWPSLLFWIGDTSIHFGEPVWNGESFVGNEYVYFGTRTLDSLAVEVEVIGADRDLFEVNQLSETSTLRQCNRIRLSFAIPDISGINLSLIEAVLRFKPTGFVAPIDVEIKF